MRSELPDDGETGEQDSPAKQDQSAPENELAEGYIGGAPMPPRILLMMLGSAILLPLVVGWFHGSKAMSDLAEDATERSWLTIIGASVDVGMMLGAIAVGIGLLVWAGMIHQRNRRVITGLVTTQRVLATRNGAVIWEEPIKNYRAVALLRDASDVEGVYFYRLELRHKDPRKSVSLGGAPNEAIGLARLDDLAAALKLRKIFPGANNAEQA